SGVSMQTLATGVRKLSVNMTDALAKPTSEVAAAFQKLGIELTNADGSMRSSQDILVQLSDKFAAMPDAAEKTALAMKLLGKSGAEMIPLLNGGSAALSQMMAEADSFGQVFTKEMGANAEAFNDNISRLTGVIGNLAARVATQLLPHMVAFSEWLVQNAPAIANFAVKMVEFGAGVAELGMAIGKLGQDIYALVTGAWAEFEAAWNRIIEKRNQLVAAMQSFGQEVIAAFMALPARMAEVGGQIIDGLWNAIKARWEVVKAGLAAFGHEIVAAFKAIPGQMAAIGTDIIDGLYSGIQQRWNAVKGGLSSIGHGVINFIKNPLQTHSPSRVMHEIGGYVIQGLANGIMANQPLALSAAQESAGAITGAFNGVQQIGGTISGMLTSAFQGLIDGSKKVKDVLKDLLGQLAQMLVNQAFQTLFGGGGGGSDPWAGLRSVRGGGGGGIFGLIGSLFGFANGGSFKVGGAGGADSQIVAFRASPNERVSVTKPGQETRHGAPVAVQVGVTVDDDGRIRAYVTDMGSKAAQTGAAMAVRQVKSSMPHLIANAQSRSM
ncbi:phage tail tape measure protein, partial [Sinorhizobium meliloti]